MREGLGERKTLEGQQLAPYHTHTEKRTPGGGGGLYRIELASSFGGV